MRHRYLAGYAAAIILAGLSVIAALAQRHESPVRTGKAQAWRTPWGEPDLQGIWGSETLTPLERPARFANRPVLTPEEAQALADEVHSRPGRDDRSERGTEKDVARAYNDYFTPTAKSLVDGRTSLIVDPPDGHIPPLTPEAQKREGAYHEYLQALLQGTSGGRPGPVSPRRNEPPPMYNTQRMNRADGPEDRATGERCFGAELPYGGGANAFYRVVQSPGQVAIFYDAFQGQGFSRVIPVDNSPHAPTRLHFFHGDSRGHWEGETLVVDTTNFTFKTNYRGSHEHLHLNERFTPSSDSRIAYRATVEDSTTWTRPWTFEVAWTREPDKPNLIFEANCQEGNYGLIGMLANMRAAERLFAAGKGPDPAKQDNATPGQNQGGIDYTSR
jgi:hypothetical protein